MKLTRKQHAFVRSLVNSAYTRAAEERADAWEKGNNEAVAFYTDVIRQAEELAEVLKGPGTVEVMEDGEEEEDGGGDFQEMPDPWFPEHGDGHPEFLAYRGPHPERLIERDL